MLLVTASRLITVLSMCNNSIHWADEDYNYVLDNFFDKAAVIVDHWGTKLALAMFIDYNLVVSSYNPFRWYRNRGGLHQIRICVLRWRKTVWKNDKASYVFEATTHGVDCARQVVPLPEHNISTMEWHHYHIKKNSPLHDITVFKMHPKGLVRWWGSYIRFPSVVSLARAHDDLGPTMMIASIGHTSKDLMKTNDHILSFKIWAEDDVLVDCERWMPRQWGLFICVKNTNKYPGLASGALLIHRRTLYGIGSFLLRKGNSSIFAFTDIRSYYHMLGAPCTFFEMYFTRNDEF